MLALFHDKKCCIYIILFLVFCVGFYCIGFSIKLVKSRAWIEEQVDFARNSWEANLWKTHVKGTCWKLESHANLEDFAIVSWVRPSREVLVKRFAWKILSVTFLPFTHTIYTLITHKSMRDYSERKTLDRFSTTHTPIF